MTTMTNDQEVEALIPACTGKVIDSGVSDQSNSTLVTLGKREATQAFAIPEAKKRQKRFDSNTSVMTEDIPNDSKADAVLAQVQDRLVKSAPTSANGSSNPDPILDIQVNLPVDHADQSSEGSEDSDVRKERR